MARKVAARGRIEAGGGFVHQQHLRAVQQRLGDFHAAPQAAGERLHQVLAAVGKPQPLHGALHAVAQDRAAQPVQMALRAQVLLHGERLVQALRLEDHAHLAAHGGGSRSTSWPAMMARPSVGTIMVDRMRKSVDLPPPFGPSRPKISPFFTSKLTFESATRSP